MLFNSLAFLIFLPIVWIGFHSLRGQTARGAWLLIASYFFYMWWRVDYAALLLTSTLVDYCCGILLGQVARQSKRRCILAISLVVNLGLLMTFKYWSFFIEQIVNVGAVLGTRLELPYLDLLLPVGISFYTFQTISYTIDVYKRKVKPEVNPVRFALYVSFFPQLVAGPIERPDRLLPQLRRLQSVDSERLINGLRLMMWGMFKKVVVADRLAMYVNVVYGDPAAHHGGHFFIATAFFSMQIYCDFSGYSDIAIGCARTLGIDLIKNFKRPYLAWSPSEFWRRWHISLSTWFRDYVYIPMGGSRRGRLIGCACLMTTFLISGLWHGASWTFVAWGAVHGCFVLIERLLKAVGPKPVNAFQRTQWRRVGTLLTIPAVCLAWVLFRADSLPTATHIMSSMVTNFSLDRLTCGIPRYHLIVSVALAFVVMAYDVGEEQEHTRAAQSLWRNIPRSVRWCGYWTVTTSILLLGHFARDEQFIYFQF